MILVARRRPCFNLSAHRSKAAVLSPSSSSIRLLVVLLVTVLSASDFVAPFSVPKTAHFHPRRPVKLATKSLTANTYSRHHVSRVTTSLRMTTKNDREDYNSIVDGTMNQRSEDLKSTAVTNATYSETDSLLEYESSSADDGVISTPESVGQQILGMAVPAAGALLLDPFMSLIDTAFVGRFATENDGPSAADQLAGMGTAAATLTLCFYLCNFLCTVTAPLIAQQRAANNKEQAIQTSGNAITLALLLGTLLCIFLWTASQPILGVMGTSRTGETAGMYATQFLTIRALAAPAVLCLQACTGIFRGYLDTKTPIAILGVANAINLFLDVVLVAGLRMGPFGAAIATTSAEWISAGLFLLVLAGKLPASGTKELGKPSDSDDVTTESSIITPNWSIPSWSEIKPLVIASASVLGRAIVLQLSVAGAAAMAARTTGSTTGIVDGDTASSAVAAHQIGIQLWLLCSFICDSLAAASQGLVADALGRKDDDAVKDISITVFQYSIVLGIVLALLLQTGTSTGLLLDIFTTRDGSNGVRAVLLNILPLIILSQPLNALVFAADGVLQGASEFTFQAKAMAISGATAVLTFLYLEHVQFSFHADGGTTLIHVWLALLTLQLARGITSLYKLADSNGPIRLFS